ncbi:hypothetical protein [Actinomadura rupiterrae]|uniref:hypothetical protein n=1 Tax=Actinomadura rupiterrae TaxID=559627 RepID=UPI0020A2D388|nr:hypothetical protein [Actinomadura rupiterrae]MCP2342445.1 hypothetical protein [Actinomadura rupiterrae]
MSSASRTSEPASGKPSVPPASTETAGDAPVQRAVVRPRRGSVREDAAPSMVVPLNRSASVGSVAATARASASLPVQRTAGRDHDRSGSNAGPSFPAVQAPPPMAFQRTIPAESSRPPHDPPGGGGQTVTRASSSPAPKRSGGNEPKRGGNGKEREPDLDELARRLVGPLSRLLRTELRLDRERVGRLRDPRR